VGGRLRPDRSEVDTTGERVEPANLHPQPESGVVVGDEYGQGGNGGNVGEGEVSSMGSSLQPGYPEPTAGDERERGLKRAKIGVEEEEGSMDSSPQLGGKEEPRNRRYRERGDAIVEGEVGPGEPPLQSNIGISGDREPSGGT